MEIGPWKIKSGLHGVGLKPEEHLEVSLQIGKHTLTTRINMRLDSEIKVKSEVSELVAHNVVRGSTVQHLIQELKEARSKIGVYIQEDRHAAKKADEILDHCQERLEKILTGEDCGNGRKEEKTSNPR